MFLKGIPLVLDICGNDGDASHWCDYGNGEFDVKLLCLTAKNVVQLKTWTRGYLVLPNHFWHGLAALQSQCHLKILGMNLLLFPIQLLVACYRAPHTGL